MSPTLPAPHRSGIYRAPANIAAARASVTAAGVIWLDVDLARVRAKTELLEVFGRSCGSPPSFGANWDALADALQDFSWRPGSGYVLHLRDAAAASRALGAHWPKLVEILAEAAIYWKGLGKPFIVFMDDVGVLAPWM